MKSLLEQSVRDSSNVSSLAAERNLRLLRGNKVEADATMRIVLVEWRIRKGHEQDFLDYWSHRETVDDRSGLVAEFLSRIEDRAEFPWITWELDERWTTFVNVGLWRNAAAFQDQIGWKLDDSRPKLRFEHERRRRIFLGPERWRVGGTTLPPADHLQVF